MSAATHLIVTFSSNKGEVKVYSQNYKSA